MQKSYTLILDSSSGEHSHVLTISETGNTTHLPGRKFYSERLSLEKDLRECLNSENAEAAARAIRSTMYRNTWTSLILLTDECAAQLGWNK
jgi:hypothetical protein